MIRSVRNRYFLMLDVVALPLAFYCTYLLRIEDWTLGTYRSQFLILLAPVVLFSLASHFWNGIYSRHWPYASADDLLALARAMGVTSGALMLAVLASQQDALTTLSIPRSVPLLFLLIGIAATSVPRLLLYYLARPKVMKLNASQSTPVLIYGAGEAGLRLLKEIHRNPQLGLQVVGLIDDDLRKKNLQILGVHVLGTRKALPALIERLDVQQVIIAMPTAPGSEIRHIRQICQSLSIHTRTIPGIHELMNGAIDARHIRDVQIEDLLRREPVQTNMDDLRALVAGKRVLVTGAGGSIGSELCRQIWRCGPQELVLLGHGENSIFAIYHELLAIAQHHPAGESLLTATIADIRFAERMQKIFQDVLPDIVFHAAAHKHVPLMERNPAEAVTNNILGTKSVLDAAIQADVDRFVMISSDKAVNPSNIMGASKRAAEMLVLQAADRTGKAYVAVRFGNVLGSRGSVVITFQRQIAMGGPVTVTHPEISRYFMTIPEAVQLVLQSAVLGKGGEIFVLDMGNPVKIVDLAHDLIELSGFRVGIDMDIVYTGLRPGEKLYEELFLSKEEYQRTRHEKIFIAHNASMLVEPSLDGTVRLLQTAAERNDGHGIRLALQTLIPESTLHRRDTVAAATRSAPHLVQTHLVSDPA